MVPLVLGRILDSVFALVTHAVLNLIAFVLSIRFDSGTSLILLLSDTLANLATESSNGLLI